MTLGNQLCEHDGACFRRNARHFLDFCHPIERTKPRCPALVRLDQCSDRDPAHVAAFYHGPTVGQLDRVQQGLSPRLWRASGAPLVTPLNENHTKRQRVTTSTTTSTTTVTTTVAASVPAMPCTGGRLRHDFVVPPFSVLDAGQGAWQARKREWLALGLDGGAGRDDDLLSGGGLAKLSAGRSTGTSIFDPVLCECAIRWFAPRAHDAGRDSDTEDDDTPPRPPPVVVVDPFAGGSTRGVVAAKLGLFYVGVELSGRQVDANRAQAAALCIDCRHQPVWFHDDGENVARCFARALHDKGLPPDTLADLVLTCPPYFSLERYGGPADTDLSMMSFDDFKAKYARILENATRLLKKRHCVVVVIGNVRTAAGELRDLHSLTKTALHDAGCPLYVDAVLKTAVASAALRAGRQMAAASKLATTHQNVVVCCKDKVLNTAACRRYNICAREEDICV